MLGQLFDYMVLLHSFYGAKDLYGIVTTYNEWKVCHIDATTPENLRDRTIEASKIFAWDTAEVAMAMYWVLKKMLSYQPTVVGLLAKRPVISIILAGGDMGNWCFKELPKTLSQLSLKPSSVSVDVLYLLREFHMSGDGKVWLGCTPGGNLQVLKFLCHGTTEERKNAATKERDCWKVAYGIDAPLLEIADGVALLLPFAFHAYKTNDTFTFSSNLDWWGNDAGSGATSMESACYCQMKGDICENIAGHDVLGVATVAINHLSTMKMLHPDVRTRHVALLPTFDGGDLSALRPILIDMSRIEMDKDPLVCMKSMTDQLNKEMQAAPK